MSLLTFVENGLNIVLKITEDGDLRLLHFSPLPYEPSAIDGEGQEQWFRLVELQVTGEDQDDHHGAKHTGTIPAKRLRFVKTHDSRNIKGRLLEFELYDPALQLKVICHWQFYEGVPAIRSWTTVENTGDQSVGLEYVSSFALTGLAKDGAREWDEKIRLHVMHNSWEGEAQWRSYTLPELGLVRVHNFALKRVAYSSTGPWSSSQFAPTACLENTEACTALMWQIEHNGSWHWEISDHRQQLYLQLSGPTEAENHWWKRLHPGESFTSVTVGISCVRGDFQDAVRAMTAYRRCIFTRGDDLRKLPVVFNDYMNCLFGDPTTEKLLPLIDAAHELGCEYFVIDAGWYVEKDIYWWDLVGDWQPSTTRFPGGFQEVIEAIRHKNMIPGIWLEIEVIGVNNPRAATLPDRWFFQRHGKRVIDHGRYQLDFRNPEVVRFADETVDRMVRQYGFGYIKIDYNIHPGAGTDLDADSFGDGLLQHNRAYLDWLDNVLARYPDLTIENCASGGMRTDYAMLSRLAVHSVSDQVDYRLFALIAAAAPGAVAPEQCANWSYPLPNDDIEAVIFNMINVLLMRVQQSGQIASISPEMHALVKAGLDYYKTIRADISDTLPYWPLGMPNFRNSEWTSVALRKDHKTYLAVWRLNSETDSVLLPLAYTGDAELQVACTYPPHPNCMWQWDESKRALEVTLPQKYSARIYEIECN